MPIAKRRTLTSDSCCMGNGLSPPKLGSVLCSRTRARTVARLGRVDHRDEPTAHDNVGRELPASLAAKQVAPASTLARDRGPKSRTTGRAFESRTRARARAQCHRTTGRRRSIGRADVLERWPRFASRCRPLGRALMCRPSCRRPRWSTSRDLCPAGDGTGSQSRQFFTARTKAEWGTPFGSN